MDLTSESNKENFQLVELDPTEVITDHHSKSFKIKFIIFILIITLLIISLIIFLLFFFVNEKIICEPGYFLPDDDKSKCIQCSEENCYKCHGKTTSNTCTSCFLGYKIDKTKCLENHSIKAIYNTNEKNITISLIHFVFIPHIKEMIVENEIVKPTNEYTFLNIGNHTIYYSFDNEIEYLGEMFYGINTLISISFTSIFDTKNITNLNFMFYGCTQLTSIDISYFNTENVLSLSGMFELCRSLLSIDLSNFNTQNVTSMSMMFYGCNSLTSINISHFNTQYLTSINSMFESCYNLTEIMLDNFDTKDVTGMSYLFDNCYSLTSINLSNFNIGKVGFMEGMFRNCYSLTSINISNFNTENITKMDSMFYGCSKLEFLDISGFTYDKNISLFYGLPESGTLVVNNDFINLIDNQIPSNWNIIYK